MPWLLLLALAAPVSSQTGGTPPQGVSPTPNPQSPATSYTPHRVYDTRKKQFIEFETLAEMYWRALQIGEPSRLSDDEMNEVIAKFATYGKR